MKKRTIFTSILTALLVFSSCLHPSLKAQAANRMNVIDTSAAMQSVDTSNADDEKKNTGGNLAAPATERPQVEPEDNSQNHSPPKDTALSEIVSPEESKMSEASHNMGRDADSENDEASPVDMYELPAAQEGFLSPETEEVIFQNGEELLDEALGEQATVVGLRKLDVTAVEVSTYSALKEAIEGSNAYTTILFANDITQDTATGDFKITVNDTKANLTIDGQGFTFTQMTSTNYERTIVVETSNAITKSITVSNMMVVGGNYWGIVHVREAVSGVTVTLQNVHYSGPQAAHNRAGTQVFMDSSIALNNRGAVAGEVSESAHVVLGGHVRVTKGNTSDAVFWLPGLSTSFTLLPRAQVTVDTAHYFIFAGGSRPVMKLGEDASLEVNQVNGMTWETQMLDTLTLGKGASLIVTQTGERGYSGLSIATALTVGKGASFEYSKTSGSNPAVHFTQSDAVATFANPRRVAMYSSVGRPLHFTGSGTLKVEVGTFNRWVTVPSPRPEGLDQLPSFYWNKAGSELLELEASYSASSVQGVTHNLEDSDPVTEDSPLTAKNLTGSTQLITFGALPFTPATPDTNHTALTGSAVDDTWLQATLSSGGILKGQADGGVYALSLGDEALAHGEMVQMLAFGSTLAARQHLLVQTAGRLSFAKMPSLLLFKNLILPVGATLVPRAEEKWQISVSDTRQNIAPWRLDAAIDRPLAGQVGGEEVDLPDALVYVDEYGTPTPLSSRPLTLFKNDGGDADIQWESTRGPLLWLAPGAARSDVNYTTTIHWTLSTVP